MIDKTYLKDRAVAIVKGLREGGVLNAEELTECAEYAFGVATAKSAREVENYRQSLATMWAVAKLRAARETEKAMFDMAWTALDLLMKAAIVAL